MHYSEQSEVVLGGGVLDTKMSLLGGGPIFMHLRVWTRGVRHIHQRGGHNWSTDETATLESATLKKPVFLVGLGATIVFLVVAVPIVGKEKTELVFDQSKNIQQILKDINIQPSTPTNPAMICGNKICETGENVSNCLPVLW